eukprot:6166620-Pleurochrysis_carterae.AAC.2
MRLDCTKWSAAAVDEQRVGLQQQRGGEEEDSRRHASRRDDELDASERGGMEVSAKRENHRALKLPDTYRKYTTRSSQCGAGSDDGTPGSLRYGVCVSFSSERVVRALEAQSTGFSTA